MKKILLIIAAAVLPVAGFSQELFRVGTKTVSKAEFLYVYGKNKDVGANIDPKTESEYLDLYVQFKRKVAAAEALGRDTMPSFLNEYNGYYKQLLKPYLTDKNVDERLVQEAYERMQWDVRASHIMVDCAENALPSDTLRAYKNILSIKDRLDRGEPFTQLAALSTDTYSAERGGDLGWFTVFGMVYPFESAVYNAPEGQVVGPIRTQFGYHLIRVTGKRPARHTMQAAHILILDTDSEPNPEAKQQIDEIYEKLQSGEPFAAAAMKYSEDPTTAKQGGRLAPFGINQMLPEFEDAAFSLTDDGTYSAPFKTKLGWHIVQRVGRNPLPDRQEAERQLAQKIRRDERSNASQKAYVDRLKREYRLDINEKNLEKFLIALEKGKGLSKASKLLLATFNETEKVTGSMVLNKIKKDSEPTIAKNVAYARFQDVVTGLILAEAERQLPTVNPEFRYLAQEYREGILVFELTREKVWDKAATDTLGLKAFFAENRSNYQWSERISGSVISGSDVKALKKAAELARQGVPVAKIQKVLNVKSEVVSVTDAEKLALGSEGKNARQAMLGQFYGPDKVKGAFEQNGIWYVLVASERLPAGPKELSECRGQVIADYQKYLEAEWMKELAGKFPLEMLGSL